jgi:hypothetical protein
VELIDADKALEQLQMQGDEKDDPMKGLLESMKQDQNKK